MNNLSQKIITIGKEKYYIYTQLVFNSDSYILVSKEGSQLNKGTRIFKLIFDKEKYYIDDEIDNQVIEKFVIYLSL